MGDKEIAKGAITQVLNGLIGSIEAEQVELYKKIIGEDGLCAVANPDTFYYKMIYPFEQFISGYIRAEISNNNDLVFLLANGQFVERFFQDEIKKREGWACSADKSGVIIKGLADFFRTRREIAWNYEGKYTYHLPKTIFTNHYTVIEFYDAIHSMYYGSSGKYLKWLANNPVDESVTL